MLRIACIEVCRPTALTVAERAAPCNLSKGIAARRSLPRKAVLCQATKQKKKSSKPKKSEVPRSKEGKGFAAGPQQGRGPAPVSDPILSLAASEGAENEQSSPTESKPLPKVTRSRVFWVCVQTSSGIAGVALLLRQFGAVPASKLLDTYSPATEALLTETGVQFGDPSHWALAVAAAAGVTAARQVLIATWPAYRDASDRSNRQMMAPLQWYDLLWLGGLPGLSEELLFRGALLPAIAADWRGVVIAGVTFGSLHFTGGRNWAFAAFASGVGAVYGAAFLATGNLVVPITAHILSNVIAAALYKQFRQPLTKS